MSLVKVEVEVPKESYELANGLAKILKAAKDAAADGWQSGQDLPVVLLEAFKELPGMISGFSDVGAEFKADKGKLLLALSIALDEVI